MNQEVELAAVTSQNSPPEVSIIVDNDENACVICLEKLDDDKSIRFHCGHIFHIRCILEWTYSLFAKNTDISCPVCRHIECHLHSSSYNEIKRALGYNQTTSNDDNEVSRRQHHNNIGTSPLRQSIHQDNLQVHDEGLQKGFRRFMVLFSFIIIGFFCFLIYAIKTGR